MNKRQSLWRRMGKKTSLLIQSKYCKKKLVVLFMNYAVCVAVLNLIKETVTMVQVDFMVLHP